MKKIIIGLLVLLSLLIVGVSATNISQGNTNNLMVCKVSHLILPNNMIGFQNPHFTCCRCLQTCPNCPCAGDFCTMGDRISKSMKLLPAEGFCGGKNCTFDGHASVNAFNLDGLDHTTISITVNHLFPRNSIFSVWLVDDNDQSKTMQIGMLRTNFVGGGLINFNQNLADLNIFDGIQIKDMNGNLVSSTSLMFNCTG